jgi:RNA polymerase sigma-70 factor (ECF subfamily)
VSTDPSGHGDDWLTDLFGRHSGAVLAYARRRVDSAEDAEDVVVEVFATAWRRRDAVPDDAALPWLYATAANVIAHVIRADGRRTRLGGRLASVRPLHAEAGDPADAVVAALDAQGAVSAALDDLAESDAELLRLWAWEQLEPAEIAAVLGCSTGTARTRMHRARARLRQALVRRGVSGPGVDGPGTEPRGDEPATDETGAGARAGAGAGPPGQSLDPPLDDTTSGSEASR